MGAVGVDVGGSAKRADHISADKKKNDTFLKSVLGNILHRAIHMCGILCLTGALFFF